MEIGIIAKRWFTGIGLVYTMAQGASAAIDDYVAYAGAVVKMIFEDGGNVLEVGLKHGVAMAVKLVGS